MHLSHARLRDALTLAAILVLAAVLRLGWPGISEFKKDEARIAALALDLAQGRSFPLHGIETSVGMPKPAVSIWIYAIPFSLSSNPMVADLFTGALNVAAVALCWWLARRYWGNRAAWIAGLMYATAPWAIFFSRKVWEPDLMSPLALGYVATGLLGFVEGKRWEQAAHVLALALLLQLHYHALLIAPLTLLLLVAYRRKLSWRSLALGTSLGLVTALPFAWYIVTSGGAFGSSVNSFASRAARWDWESVRLWWSLVSGNGIHSLAGSAYESFLRLLPGLGIVQWIVGLLALAGIGVSLWQAVAHRRECGAAAAGIVAAWALLPALLTLYRSTELYLHYFTPLLPAPYLAVGYLLSRRLPSLRRSSSAPVSHSMLRSATSVLPAALVIALSLAQTASFLALLSFVATHVTPGGLGLPLGKLLDARRAAVASRTEVVVLTPDDDLETSPWAGVWDVLLRGQPHRFVDSRNAILFPASRAAILVTTEAEGAASGYAGYVDASDSATISTRSGEPPFTVIQWHPGQTPEYAEIPGPRALDNGAELIGYRADAPLPGQPLTCEIVWRVWKTPSDPGASYHLFCHLVDSDGKRLGQADIPAVRTADWQVGDIVMQPLTMAVPAQASAAPFYLRIGMYAYPSMAAQPVLDVAANPAGDFVVVGPLP